MAVLRARNFATIIYPDSVSDSWIERARDFHVPFFISPLHDKDILDSSTGELKKPHYHFMMMFEGKKSKEQVLEIFQKIAGEGFAGCEIVNSARGMARYLCHMDDENKTPYNPDDVIEYIADYQSLCGLPADKLHLLREILSYCEENKISDYGDLILISLQHDSWLSLVTSSKNFPIRAYLDSRKKYGYRKEGKENERF